MNSKDAINHILQIKRDKFKELETAKNTPPELIEAYKSAILKLEELIK